MIVVRTGFKIFLVLFFLMIGSCYLIGPSRMYGYARCMEITATVNNIRSFTQDNAEIFAIELQTDQGEIYTVTSCEKIWGIIAKEDYLKVKLYPSAPWSSNGGCWVNAKLMNKLVRKK